MRWQWRRLPERPPRFAPFAGTTARDHPVDRTGDDSRAGHDFEMTPHNTLKTKRLGIERDQTEIAGETHNAAADRIGQRAPDIKCLGDRDHDHRWQQREAADEDDAETEQDVQ